MRFTNVISLRIYSCDEDITTQETVPWVKLKKTVCWAHSRKGSSRTNPERGTIEFNLSIFEDWYKGRYDFHQILKELEEQNLASNESAESCYVLRVFFFYQTPVIVKLSGQLIKSLWKAKILDFYKSIFKVKKDQESIKSSVTKHPSIVIIGTKTSDKAEVYSLCFPTQEITKNVTFVIGALTYMLRPKWSFPSRDCQRSMHDTFVVCNRISRFESRSIS